MMSQTVINEIVARTSKLQDTTTRLELIQYLQTIIESPKFKAYSALDIVQLVLNKLREGEHDQQS